jgi:hypothetical protein
MLVQQRVQQPARTLAQSGAEGNAFNVADNGP